MRTRTHSGISVIELMAVLAIFILISFALYTLLKSLNASNRYLFAHVAAQEEARKVLKPLVAEIRNASDSVMGSYLLEAATSTSFIFYTNIDADLQTERVRYFLENRIVKKGVTQPSGSPLRYAPTTEVITEVIHNVDNSASDPLFQYYNTLYTGSEAALSTPIYLPDIRVVKIYAMIKPLQTPSATSTIVTTQIHVRATAH
jgi:hypothetical protein